LKGFIIIIIINFYNAFIIQESKSIDQKLFRKTNELKVWN
jgi:hypothetical protein